MHFSALFMVKKTQLILFSLIAVASISQVFATSSIQIASSKSAMSATTLVSKSTKPLWVELSAQQKLAIAPLSPEWDRMDETQKKKWLKIANKYPAMKPDEQARVQERIRAWVKLSPEQRMQARENFARTTQIKPEQKSAQWQQYQQLSDEQKKQLANEVNRKKSITNIPPESQRNAKPLAPIRVGPALTTKPAQKPIPIQPLQVTQPATSLASPVAPLTTSNSAASQAVAK